MHSGCVWEAKETFSKLEASLGYIDTERCPRGMTFWIGAGVGKCQIEAISPKVLHTRVWRHCLSETEGVLPVVCPRPGDLWSLSLSWCLLWDYFQAPSTGSGLLCCCVWVAEAWGGRHLPVPEIIQLQMRQWEASDSPTQALASSIVFARPREVMQQAQGHPADKAGLAGIAVGGGAQRGVDHASPATAWAAPVSGRTAMGGIKLVRHGARRPEHSCS